MTVSSLPFEDPAFAELVRQTGAYRPGVAAELMGQLAPLLAADGFDVERLDDDVDPEAFHAAMSRAVERHSMQAVTPIHTQRQRTVVLLREIVVAFGRGATDRVEKLLAKLRLWPTATRVSTGHLIGVTLELLDAWFTTQRTRAALVDVEYRHIPAELLQLVQEIQALAQLGQATRSIPRLQQRHDAELVAAGGALLVAAATRNLARARNANIADVVETLIPGAPRADTPGYDVTPAVMQHLDGAQLMGLFRTWLRRSPEAVLSDPGDFDIFDAWVHGAVAQGVDPFEATEFRAFRALVEQSPDAGVLRWTTTMLQDYVNFQLQLDEDPEGWGAVDHLLDDDAPAAPSSALAELATLMQQADADLPIAQRRAAVTGTAVVAGIPGVLDLVGTSRSITATAAPKRDDIAALCALLGFDVQGVGQLPETAASQSPTRYVRTAWEVPELMVWWQLLTDFQLLQRSATRVAPGEQAAAYRDLDTVDVEELEAVIAGFLRAYVLDALQRDPDAAPSIMQALQRVLNAMLPGDVGFDVIDDPVPQSQGSDAAVADRLLHSLATMGLIRLEEGAPIVPEALHPGMLLGIALLLKALSNPTDEA